MLELAVNGYTREEVMEALHAKSGTREVSFFYVLLGENGSIKFEPEVVSGQITMDAAGQVKRTGRFVLRDDERIAWQTDMLQPWFRLRMKNGFAAWPLGVFYMPTAPRAGRPGHYYRETEAYDASYAVFGDTYIERHIVLAGTPYVDAVRSTLASSGVKAPLLGACAYASERTLEWEPGMPKGRVCSDLLQAIGFEELWVNAHGQFIAREYTPPGARGASYAYEAGDMSVLLEAGRRRADLFNLPNVFRGVVSKPDGVMAYTAEIDDPAHPLSAARRGGRKVLSCVRYDDMASYDALRANVERAAREAAQACEEVEFETLLMPHHEVGDTLELNMSAGRGRYTECMWTMKLEAGAAMRHRACANLRVNA